MPSSRRLPFVRVRPRGGRLALSAAGAVVVACSASGSDTASRAPDFGQGGGDERSMAVAGTGDGGGGGEVAGRGGTQAELAGGGGATDETGPMPDAPAPGGAGGGAGDGAEAGATGTSGTSGTSGTDDGSGGSAIATAGTSNEPDPDETEPAGGDACEIVCDDFESGELDPSRWRVVGAAPEISQERARSGSRSLLFRDLGQTGRFVTSAAPFPAEGTLFLRAYMNFENATVDMSGHTGFIVGADQDTNGAELRWGQSQPGCVAQNQLLDLNHVPTDRTICSSGLVSGGNPNDFPGPGVTLEADQWYCVELLFSAAGEGEFRLWIDDVEVDVLRAGPSAWCPPEQAGCGTPEPWPIEYSLVKFGTQVYNGGAGNIWYDDLALGTARIGCD